MQFSSNPFTSRRDDVRPAPGRPLQRMLGWSRLFALLSLLISVAALLAWVFDMPQLIRPLDGQAIHPVTALASLGVALSALLGGDRRRARDVLSDALAVMVLLLMLARLLFEARVAPLLDMLVPSHMVADPEPFPAVSANSAACLVLLCAAHLLRDRLDALLSQVLVFVAYGLPTLSLVGYLLGVGQFHGRMSLTTVLIQMPLCVAMALTTVRKGFLRRLLGPARVSAIARRYLLLVMMLPYLFGFVLYQFGGSAAGLPMVMLIVATSQMAGLCVCFLALASANIELSRTAATRLAEARSRRDTLTGAMSREHFTRRAGGIIDARARRADQLSLLFIDIDHFKHINDHYGHPEGDRVLQRTIRVTRACLRRDDIIARWGGEEFVVLLPGTDIEGARAIAETIRRAIDNTCFDPALGELHVTVSIGCAEIGANEGLGDLIERADKAVYRAKNSGRNRIVAL